MKKVIYWTLGCVIGLPLAFILFHFFQVWVSYPLKHTYQVWRMDAKNRQIWEEDIGRVAQLQIEVTTPSGVENVEGSLVCYEGYSAYPYDWKSHPRSPSTRKHIRIAGPKFFNVPLPSRAVLEFDLSRACYDVVRMDLTTGPVAFQRLEAILVDRERCFYSPLPRSALERNRELRTRDVSVGPVQVMSLEAFPLRDVVDFDQLGTSSVSYYAERVSQRWPFVLSKEGCY